MDRQWAYRVLNTNIHRSFLTTTTTTGSYEAKDAVDEATQRLEAVASALQVCVLLGIEREIAVFHPGYHLVTR